MRRPVRDTSVAAIDATVYSSARVDEATGASATGTTA